MRNQFKKVAEKYGFRVSVTTSIPEYDMRVHTVSVYDGVAFRGIFSYGYFLGVEETAEDQANAIAEFEEELVKLKD